MPNFKLTYFNGRGRAEISRLIFAVAGAPYEDIRIKDWPNGKSESPLGQLPYLTVDGLKVPQGVAIARFLARLFNLYGRDELESLKTDAVVDTSYDLQTVYYTKVYPQKTSKETIDKFLGDDAVTHLTRFEKIVSMYGTAEGFSVGDQLTWADLAIYDATSLVVDLKSDILKDYPKTQAVRKAVETHPRIADYLKTRPVTDF